jgi:hypothetical protein
LRSLASGKSSEISDALISAAYWDEDWRWAQEQLLTFSTSEDENVLWSVALGIGFVAVFHGEIDDALVTPVLARIKRWPGLSSVVEDTQEDIEHFVHRRRRGEDVDLGTRLPPPEGVQ